MYINDIANALTITTYSFADDTTLLISDTDIKSLNARANIQLNLLNEWLGSNKLALNTEKTNYMIFCPKHRKCINNNLELKLNGITLMRIGDDKETNTIKFLGLLIDEHITWKPHIAQINSKISKTLFALNKTKNTLPRKTRKIIYTSLIQPILTYGILAWGSSVNNANNKILYMQKRAIRSINNMPYNGHTDPLFKKDKILKISELYKLEVLKFMIKYEKHMLPDSFNHLFTHNFEIHPARITRQANHIYVNRTTNKFVSNLPKFKIPLLWNIWIDKIDLSLSIHTLQKTIKREMLETYSESVNCTNNYCRQCYPT